MKHKQIYFRGIILALVLVFSGTMTGFANNVVEGKAETIPEVSFAEGYGTEKETEAEGGIETEAETEAEAGIETEAETEAEAGIETETGTEAEAGTEAETTTEIAENESLAAEKERYPVADGETGVVDTSYPRGHVKRYGAVGDGAADDTKALQHAFSEHGNAGIVFEEGETYRITSGMILGNKVDIEGNGATIVIDSIESWFYDETKSYENNGKGLFYYIFFMPENYSGVSESWVFRNLNIDWEVSQDITHVNTYFLFKIMNVQEVIFQNVDVTINGNENNSIHPFWFARQSERVLFDGCTIENNCHGFYGSGIWIHAMEGGGYPDFTIQNCSFYQESRDEMISVWGLYTQSVTIRNCDFTRRGVTCTNSTRNGTSNNDLVFAVNIISDSEEKGPEGAVHEVLFDGCTIEVIDAGNKVKNFIQQISQDGSKVITEFRNCSITAELETTFLSGETRENMTKIDNNETFYENCRISFDSCEMNLRCPTLATSRSVNFEFHGCSIVKNDSLIDVRYPDTRLVSSWNGVFTDNVIDIVEADGILKNINENYKNKITLKDNDINLHGINGAKSVEQLITVGQEPLPEFVQLSHQLNAEYRLEVDGNQLNVN